MLKDGHVLFRQITQITKKLSLAVGTVSSRISKLTEGAILSIDWLANLETG